MSAKLQNQVLFGEYFDIIEQIALTIFKTSPYIKVCFNNIAATENCFISFYYYCDIKNGLKDLADMDRSLPVIVFILHFVFNVSAYSGGPSSSIFNSPCTEKQDSIYERQLLYNGRIWRNLYSNIVGGEFLYSNDWITGEVNINDIIFKQIPLRYDIYNDQLITVLNQGIFVQLNKELVSRFVIPFENRSNVFENFDNDGGNSKYGYCQVLYKGNICLLVKHLKLIKILAVQNRYDEFYENQIIYVLKDGKFFRISRKKDIIGMFSDKKAQIMNFIRTNKIRMRKRNPDSFVPVVKYYDNLK